MRAQSERTLLLVDDEPASVRLLGAMASRAGWRWIAAGDPARAPAELARRDCSHVDAVLLNCWSPAQGSGGAIAALKRDLPDAPVLMLTTQDALGDAVAALRAGAADYLLKPIAPHALVTALEAATAERTVGGELRPLAEKLPAQLGFGEIVGRDPALIAALATAAKAARGHVPVLIEGESGTGKELVAEAIHTAGPRGKGPLINVNCGAVPAALVDSELFGHERGAFTGAFDRFIGRFGEADGGTIILDEVGELPPETQVKLLRVLEDGTVTPLGGRSVRRVDVRVIATSTRSLGEQAAAGRFREDLFYRLNAVHVALPPLRERLADLPLLVRHLLDRIGAQPAMRALTIDPEAMALLGDYRWPGNVRELQSALFRASVMCPGGTLAPADFPEVARAAGADRHTATTAIASPRGGIAIFDMSGHLRPLDAIEADVIRLAIDHYRGRMTEVARRLGIGRSTLYRKLGELGVEHAA